MILIYYCLAMFVFLTFSNKRYTLANSVIVLMLVMLVVCFSFVYGIRIDGLGSDTKSYMSAFSTIEQFQPRWEIGFIEYMKFLSHIGFDSAEFIFITCIISIVLLAIYSYCILDGDKKYSIAILFILLSSVSVVDILINGIRQGLGICIFYFGISLYFNKWTKISFFVIFIACLVHNSIFILSICFLFSLFLVRRTKNTTIYTLTVLISATITIILGIDIKEEVFRIISNFGFSEGLIIVDRLSHYSDYDFGLFSTSSLLAKSLMIIPLFIPILAHMLFKIKESNVKYETLYILYCQILTIYFLLLYQPASYRYAYLVAPLLPVIYFYNLLYSNSVKYSKNACVFITLIFCTLYASKLIWFDILMK